MDNVVTNASTEITWHASSRVALIRYATDASLTTVDGTFLVDALTSWVGAENMPFAVLADAKGLRGTDGSYRALAGSFFRKHRDTAFVALINQGPVIHIVVEMFRIATGIQLKTFGSETDARAWLQHQGIAA